MRYRIEKLNWSEWERIRRIRLLALSDSPDAFGSTFEREYGFSEEDWIRRERRDGVATFLAVSQAGEDKGLVVGAPYEGRAGLFSMWVSPSARGNGVGGLLVDAVCEWALGEGHSEVILDVGDNNSAAIALYESKGFVPNGVVGSLSPPRQHITEHQRVRKLLQQA